MHNEKVNTLQDEKTNHHNYDRRLHASWVVGETEKIFKEVQEVLESYAAEMND
mgnify:FL=1